MHHRVSDLSESLPTINYFGEPTVGLAVKHRQLARQIEVFAKNHLENSMANFGDSNTMPEGTTIIFDSCVYTANSFGGFTSHLANPMELETRDST